MRQVLFDALVASGKPMSLYEVMATTKIGGWDAGQELKAMARDGVTVVARSCGVTLFSLYSYP
jgi:hypothetical protein